MGLAVAVAVAVAVAAAAAPAAADVPAPVRAPDDLSAVSSFPATYFPFRVSAYTWAGEVRGTVPSMMGVWFLGQKAVDGRYRVTCPPSPRLSYLGWCVLSSGPFPNF